ncbi:unnamed protein product [Gadus morhua 'NCC']
MALSLLWLMTIFRISPCDRVTFMLTPKPVVNRLKTDWLEERVETRDTLGQSRGRQLKRNPNDLKRNPNNLKRKPKPS